MRDENFATEAVRRPMRWPIRYQILLPFSLCMLAAVAAVSLLNAYWAASRAEAQIERQLQSVARTLRDTTFPLTNAVLEQMHGLSGAEFVVTDERGRVLATSGPRESISTNDEQPVDDWRRFRLGPAVTIDGRSYFGSTLLLARRDGRREPVRLSILYPRDVWREARREAMAPPVIVGVAALVAVIAVGLVVAVRISRPIHAVVQGVGRLASGDYSRLETPQRNDELRDLVGSVNRLAGELEELRGAVARAERLSLLGQLSGGLAHHLRNAIAGAKMALQLHQRACGGEDQESLDMALRQLALTEERLKQFLSAGKPAAPRRAACDLGGVIDDLTALVEPSCTHRRVTLEWRPPADGPVVVDVDAEQIRQALLNLLFNGMEAAPRGGWVRVELASARTAGVVVRVEDSGPGVPDDMADRLFEAFASGKSEGIGLGLAVARQAARAHGGDVVYERAGETTRFELRLPSACLLPTTAAARNTMDGEPAGQRPILPR